MNDILQGGYMNISAFFLKITLILIVFIAPSSVFAAEVPPEVLEKARKGVVTINTRVSVSAYKNTGNWTGTGFISSKKDGLIITNAHMISPASIGIYFISFFNGQEAEAKLLYYDSWQDFAILKIDPTNIPADALELAFSQDRKSTRLNSSH